MTQRIIALSLITEDYGILENDFNIEQPRKCSAAAAEMCFSKLTII